MTRNTAKARTFLPTAVFGMGFGAMMNGSAENNMLPDKHLQKSMRPDLRDRMMTGRFKVFDHCSEWFEEFRQYYRKDGRIVKAHDDLLDATRYGVMMLRFAKEVKDGKIKRRRPAVVKGVEYDVFNY